MLDSQSIYCKSGSERMRGICETAKMNTSTTCEVSNFDNSKSMNEIWSREILWTRRVLELGARKVPRLLTIGTTLLGQQVAEQVARTLRGFGVLVEGHVKHAVRRSAMVFANSRGRSIQSEREFVCCRRQRSSTRTIIEEDRLLLPSGNLLNGGAWAAGFAINICHVIADREGVLRFRMSPEDGGFDSDGIVDRSRTRDVSHV